MLGDEGVANCLMFDGNSLKEIFAHASTFLPKETRKRFTKCRTYIKCTNVLLTHLS